MKIRHGNDAVVEGTLEKKKDHHAMVWEIDIAGATIDEVGRNGLSITAGKRHLVLYTRDEDDWRRWRSALKVAVLQKLEVYYRIKEKIGEGGFAVVYLAEDIETRQPVAVKTIDKGASTTDFLSREVAILKDIDSPFVCSTFDIFETSTQLHIVLEFMGGGNLYGVLETNRKLPEKHTKAVMRQVLAGVLYLHDHGIVHRDLKPENLLLEKESHLGVIRLADFGLSRYEEEGKMMHTMIGTPQFSALEILRDEKYGREVDLWSCGIICYNMLTGMLPFGVNEVLTKYASGNVQVPYPTEMWDHVSPEAKQFTMQLLCNDQHVRLSAAGALCSPWLTNDSRHVWNDLLGTGKCEPSMAGVECQQVEEDRGQQLLAEAISKHAKRKWGAAIVCIRALIRTRLLTACSRANIRPEDALLQQSSCSSMDSSQAPSEWDYSEADHQWNLSQASSFDSNTFDESSVERSASRRQEAQEKALKWQEDVMSPGENGIAAARRERRDADRTRTHFARVSMTDPSQGRGFKKKRESCGENLEGLPAFLDNTPSLENIDSSKDCGSGGTGETKGGHHHLSPSTVVARKKVSDSVRSILRPLHGRNKKTS